MTISTLFGTETGTPKTIRFKCIKAVYDTLVVKDHNYIYNHFKTGSRYTSPVQIFESFRFLMQETKEIFLTAHLDGKNKLVAIDVVSIGSLNQAVVHPREVFKTALLSNAAALILVHQHPSGDPAPSPEDVQITRRLKQVGDIIGIKVLDHIIVGEDDYCSFVEKGLM